MFEIEKWVRTVLTAIGVMWGICILILLLGFGNGLRNGVETNFRGFAVNSIYVWPQKTTLPYKGLKPGRFYVFRNGDIGALKNNVPEIDALAPRIQLGGWRESNNVTRGDKAGNFRVMGDYPEFQQVEVMEIVNGRFLNQLDLQNTRKVCVIGEQVLSELFGAGVNPVGEYIKIQEVYFKVVGLFKSTKNMGHQADRDARTIYIPYSTFQKAFNYGDRMSWFSLTTDKGADPNVVEEKVRQVLMARHNISPVDERAIGSYNAEEQAQKWTGLFVAIRIFVWFVGVGTLVAGVIGVTVIMLVVVNERTKEIGLRKAVGATPMSIILMILKEATLLTALAGCLGVVIGVGILEGVSYLMAQFGGNTGFFQNPEVDFFTVLMATGVLVLAGALAGVIPAIKAANVNPIIALRKE